MATRTLIEADAAAAALVPIVQIPFTSGIAADIGNPGVINFSRASTQLYIDDAGVWRSVANNVAATSSKGIFLAPPATNRCTNYNLGSVTTGVTVSGGTLSSIVDGAALTAAGLGVLTLTYLRFVNDTGLTQTVDIAGATAAANATISIFARVTAQTATLQLNNGVGAVPMAPNTTFERFYSEKLAASLNTLQISVPAGGTVEWVLNQLEDSASATNLTPPIIVAGAAASRAGTFLYFTNANQLLPTNNFIAYFEYECWSPTQFQNYPVIFKLYANASNSLTLAGLGELDKTVAGVGFSSRGKMVNAKRTTAVAISQTEDRGVELFVNGSRAHKPALQTSPLPFVAASNVYIGNTTYVGDSHFTGWIRNVRIYSGKQSRKVLQALTNRYDESTDLGLRGLPCHDRTVTGRIWSLRWNNTADYYDAIEYSDDWGTTWTEWVTLANPAAQGTLQMDAQGNFYYAIQAGSPTYDSMVRIQRSNKAVSFPLKWLPNAVSSHGWLPWTWGVDSAGRIFTASYYAPNDGTDGHYIYRSLDDGVTWTSFNYLITSYPLDRHIHSLRVNPYDDSVYVCWGDNVATRGTARSTDAFATAPTVVTDGVANGPTGMAFTSEAAYFASDAVGSANYVRRSVAGAAMTTAYAMTTHLNLAPLYFIEAVGDNELWILAWNEQLGSNTPGGIYKLTKKAGLNSPWGVEKFIALEDNALDGGMRYSIAGTGVIPATCPYIFVQIERPTGGSGTAPKRQMLRRITRAIVASGDPKVVRSMFREL